MKRKAKSFGEMDVVTNWRRWLTYTQRAGVCQKIKRGMNRRERRTAKVRIQRGDDAY